MKFWSFRSSDCCDLPKSEAKQKINWQENSGNCEVNIKAKESWKTAEKKQQLIVFNDSE